MKKIIFIALLISTVSNAQDKWTPFISPGVWTENISKTTGFGLEIGVFKKRIAIDICMAESKSSSIGVRSYFSQFQYKQFQFYWDASVEVVTNQQLIYTPGFAVSWQPLKNVAIETGFSVPISSTVDTEEWVSVNFYL